MSMTAKVFMSGRSQALRWPASLRLQAKEVRIEPLGDGFLIRPVEEPSSHLGSWIKNYYEQHPPAPEDFLVERSDPPQERPWSDNLYSTSTE
jgi:antitoxin VapB